MRPTAKSVKQQGRSTKSSRILNTTIKLPQNAGEGEEYITGSI